MTTPTPANLQNVDCAILLGDCGPVIASGKSLGVETKLRASFGMPKPADADPWIGFQIKIPLGPKQKANEAAGFGVCHVYKPSDESVLASEEYIIDIRFPRAAFQSWYEEVPEKVKALFPDVKNLSYLNVCFNDTKPIVIGYGRPFANAEDAQVDDWVNKNKPLLKDCTLLDVLQMEMYHAVLPIKVSDAEKNFDLGRLPEPFQFPYGPQQWNVNRFKAAIAENPGHRFKATYVHPDNKSMLVVMTQAVVQDVMWLDDAVQKIGEVKVRGYFVPAAREDQFHVVIALPDEFMKEFEAPWRRLTKKTPAFNLHMYNRKVSDAPAADWDCKITSHPKNIPELAKHSIEHRELVLLVRRPLAHEKRNDRYRGRDFPIKLHNWLSLEFDAGLVEAHRRVQSISCFGLETKPINVEAAGLPRDYKTGHLADDLTLDQYKVLIETCDRMDLHREVLRGAGFYDWMTRKVPKVPAWAASMSPTKRASVSNSPSGKSSVGNSPGGRSPAGRPSAGNSPAGKSPAGKSPIGMSPVGKSPVGKSPMSQSPGGYAVNVTEGVANLRISSKGSFLRPLPVLNFLSINDPEYADCILEEALPQDRARFRQYLSKRPLGLGMIIGGAGFGKTTAGAAATLAMRARLGKILCSGPTNVAIDNFADRLVQRDQAITNRLNKTKTFSDNGRRRYNLIVRGYNPDHEAGAVASLLKDPNLGDEAAPSNSWKFPSAWKLNSSCTFWLLLVLRSPGAGRKLHPDDPRFLHDLQKRIDDRKDLLPLRQVATGAITWKDFTDTIKRDLFFEAIDTFIGLIIDNADILCITPAESVNHKSFLRWKLSRARGFAIDEAGCLSRGDLCCVWGNTLLPCFLFGDPRQLPPPVMTTTETIPNTDLFLNRFANYGEISALGALQASGLPVYRLKVQLRMASGMFDIISRVIYPDVDFTYHNNRAVSNPEFKAGHDIEAFFTGKFPDLLPPASGTLQPIFVHCQNSTVFVDSKTGSRRSADQVRVALDLISEMVHSIDINLQDLVVISPYMANVKLINSMRKSYPSLANLQDATTIDSYQGRESTVVFVVMSTAHPVPGPGFTSNRQRLNVLLTRQKCALVVIGDINVGHPFKGGTKEPVFRVEDVAGDIAYVKATALRPVHRELKKIGRVVTVNVNKDKAKES
ncbi:DNA helicase [Fusarium heterosporum]|uniref:DNA helicase n=1 Tax=Fusarium heterosporum TaxID=42747 RepID=A0A8H5TZR3_FUSHE|nr:DNA helicase [Fusarium heterosporum]